MKINLDCFVALIKLVIPVACACRVYIDKRLYMSDESESSNIFCDFSLLFYFKSKFVTTTRLHPILFKKKSANDHRKPTLH